MEIYALFGPSGTGKSTSALQYAYSKMIPAIIDDGLLIYMGEKIAGRSAKYEENRITAIKRAMFYYQDHREEVKNKIEKLAIQKILILGTSKKMVDYIANALQLGQISYYADVENVRSSSEIKMALFERKTKGEHVIPIPAIQVERGFFRRMIFKGSKVFSLKKELIGENTIVYPGFQIATISIYPDVLKKIVSYRCKSIPEIQDYSNIQVTLGQIPTVSLSLKLFISEKTVLETIKNIQKKIKEDYQNHLDIELHSIDIHIEKVRQGDRYRVPVYSVSG